MKIKIQHLSLYKYNQPVFLESQEIRLCPRSDGNTKICDFHYKIEPEPDSSGIIIDGEGNCVIKVWFMQETEYLNVKISWTGENTNSNPYNFIINLDNTDLPAKYNPVNEKPLELYRKIENESNIVRAFSDSIAQKTDNKILLFLKELTSEIYNIFIYEKREEGDPYAPEFILQHKKGSCRDLAVLFMECCKYQGLAVKFVSGYRIDKESNEKNDLHAWVEVYIEGGGWRGFDPSVGLAVNDEYFALATSYLPSVTLPVSGTYRSDYSTSELKTLINAEIL